MFSEGPLVINYSNRTVICRVAAFQCLPSSLWNRKNIKLIGSFCGCYAGLLMQNNLRREKEKKTMENIAGSSLAGGGGRS